jgi:hypothetical protein
MGMQRADSAQIDPQRFAELEERTEEFWSLVSDKPLESGDEFRFTGPTYVVAVLAEQLERCREQRDNLEMYQTEDLPQG